MLFAHAEKKSQGGDENSLPLRFAEKQEGVMILRFIRKVRTNTRIDGRI